MKWVTPWPSLKDGEIIDLGYGDFICTPATAQKLMQGGMTHVNGQRVILTIVHNLPAVNAVVLNFQSADGDNISQEWARYWAGLKTEALA
jgi:hypothetical protein